MVRSRRNFLLGAGGALALVGLGGAWQVTRMPVSAIAPWTFDPAPLPDRRLDAFRYAILAPNPHNRQPWMIRLVGDNQADLFIDTDKRLPQTDPFDRQLTIGFGTFIEVARIAAAQNGVRIEVEPFPDGESQPRLDKRPLARLTFVKDQTVKPDPLFASILKRRTNRNLYSAAPTGEQLVALQRHGAVASADAALLAQLRRITVGAITTETRTPRTHQESVDLHRIGHNEVDTTPDGLFLTGPMIEATAIAGLTTRKTIADPKSQSFQIGLDELRASCGSVPAALWIMSQGNSRADQLEAGQRYVRTNLQATTLGLAMHPMSQSLQEYPEMVESFADVHKLLGASGEARVQMLARVGRADAVPAAGRWPLGKHLLT